MDLNEYQQLACRTSAFYERGMASPANFAMSALGLAGETGEVCDLIKKALYHGHTLDYDKIKLELGDVLWYIAALSCALGMELNEVADGNIEKLKSRYGTAFSTEASINRKE